MSLAECPDSGVDAQATRSSEVGELAEVRKLQQERYKQHQQQVSQQLPVRLSSGLSHIKRTPLRFHGKRFYTNKLEFATGDGNVDALNFADLVDSVCV